MKILSMTATFGKLEHQTLTLKPGLNVIHAPNEWGKSTWCAFIVAMLYGIDTKERNTQNTLADKEHYKPWSGSPMSGRMEIQWQGREITIERNTKGRAIMGQFSAYETATGLPVPELTAENCGQVLLGVEKSVFVRSGFVRLTDMPITNDESLRRRLNALVTTGDESGASDALAQKLKDLKNSVRHNKTGLLPQAQAQKSALQEKYQQLQSLQEMERSLAERQVQYEQRRKELLNHQIALEHAANCAYGEKLAAAETAQSVAQAKVTELEAGCEALPPEADIDTSLLQLQQLRSELDTLHTEAQLLPPQPQQPEIPSCFKGLCREDALRQAQTDARVYYEVVREKKQFLPFVAGLSLAAVSLLFLLIPHWIGVCCGIAGILSGTALAAMNAAARRRAANTVHALENKYAPLSPDAWEKAAGDWADAQSAYVAQTEEYQNQRQSLQQRTEALRQKSEALTGGQPLALCQQQWLDAKNRLQTLNDARKELERAAELAAALRESHKKCQSPQFPDLLSLSEAETAQQLTDCTYQLQQLQHRLGQCQGQMEALGQADMLQQQLAVQQQRIEKLEDIYTALVIAQQTLTDTADALQRRFAPKITKTAQTLFGQMTGGRYDRLVLGQDLSVSVAAREEDTLQGGMWRSDGTVDQLYLALRLAVTRELTPDAPLVLDDALVRFDELRLSLALDILQQEAEHKQVILFTCQNREETYLAGK